MAGFIFPRGDYLPAYARSINYTAEVEQNSTVLLSWKHAAAQTCIFLRGGGVTLTEEAHSSGKNPATGRVFLYG